MVIKTKKVKINAKPNANIREIFCICWEVSFLLEVNILCHFETLDTFLICALLFLNGQNTNTKMAQINIS